jgi:trk system potassium uptake protein TrkH
MSSYSVHARPVLFVIGLLLIILSLAEIIPAMADMAEESGDWLAFAESSAATMFVGIVLCLSTYSPGIKLSLRQGFLLTVASWFVLSIFAALPLELSDAHLSLADAVFEAVSGLTTTGSTVLTGLDNLPHGILIWRALLQWLGGIGIVAMAVVLLPFLRIGGMQLFKMESSDQSEKVMPRAIGVIGAILAIYCLLTALASLAYWMAGMSGFEAMVHAMTTVSTGGYSTSDGSLGHFHSMLIDWIAIVFMVAASIPFVLYVRMLGHRHVPFWQDSQVRFFLTLLAAAVLSVTFWHWLHSNDSLGHALTVSAFSVVSVITTTGYAVEDYTAWGAFAVLMFFVLTALGGCTGSTAGGLKMLRLQIAWIAIREQLLHIVQPRRVIVNNYNNRPLSEGVVASVMVLFLAFVTSVIVLALGLALSGLDPLTSISGALTAVANVGPGIGKIIGPAGTFTSLNDSAEWLLSGGMLLGRLEFLTVLVVFSPEFWLD